MADTPTVDLVRSDLRVFYHGRRVDEANQIISRILRQHGAGARTVSVFDPKYYGDVYRAAGGPHDGRSPLD